MSNYIDPVFRKKFPFINYFRRHKTPHPPQGFTEKEWHHAYVGIACITFGFVFVLFAPFQAIFFQPLNIKMIWWGVGLLLFGVWNFVDDMAQHKRQVKEIARDGYYRTMSFLHWIFEPLYSIWGAMLKNH
jgi:hypothetical protein